MKFFIASLFFSLTAYAASPPKDFSAVKCPSVEVIAKNYLELETNGWRISHSCIDRSAYPYLNVLTPPRSAEDGVPLTAEMASEETPFTIDKIENIDAMHHKVSFRYHLQGDAKGKGLSDVLYFDTLQGPLKAHMGCALLAKPPQHLVVRQKCGR